MQVVNRVSNNVMKLEIKQKSTYATNLTEGNIHSEIIHGKAIIVSDMNEAMCGAHLCDSLSKSSSTIMLWDCCRLLVSYL